MISLSFLLACSFIYLFFKKKSEMRSKIEQLATRLQDSELEVSWQLSSYFIGTPDRKESRVDSNWANLELHSILDLRPSLFWTKQWAIVPLKKGLYGSWSAFIFPKETSQDRLFCPVPQSYSRHQSCAKENSSGVENELHSCPSASESPYSERLGTG